MAGGGDHARDGRARDPVGFHDSDGSAAIHDLIVYPVMAITCDLTKGNVLRSADGEIFLLDFAVASQYPRIQEIAVIAANLMHGCQSSLEQRVVLGLSADKRIEGGPRLMGLRCT